MIEQRKRMYSITYGDTGIRVVRAESASEAVSLCARPDRQPDTITDMTAVADWKASIGRRMADPSAVRRMPLRDRMFSDEPETVMHTWAPKELGR
jgi:hypothetical protein